MLWKVLGCFSGFSFVGVSVVLTCFVGLWVLLFACLFVW